MIMLKFRLAEKRKGPPVRRAFRNLGSGAAELLPDYPFAGRAASIAGDQRHHQARAIRFII